LLGGYKGNPNLTFSNFVRMALSLSHLFSEKYRYNGTIGIRIPLNLRLKQQ
jgi:hypothetical protein